MRVISQNGMFDFSYEQIAVYRNDNIVLCRFSNVERLANILGVYSTEEKAQKVMVMLRNAYVGQFIGKNVEVSDSTIEELREMMKTGFGCIRIREGNSGIADFQPLHTYFKFPQDSEVE